MSAEVSKYAYVRLVDLYKLFTDSISDILPGYCQKSTGVDFMLKLLEKCPKYEVTELHCRQSTEGFDKYCIPYDSMVNNAKHTIAEQLAEHLCDNVIQWEEETATPIGPQLKGTIRFLGDVIKSDKEVKL